MSSPKQQGGSCSNPDALTGAHTKGRKVCAQANHQKLSYSEFFGIHAFKYAAGVILVGCLWLTFC